MISFYQNNKKVDNIIDDFAKEIYVVYESDIINSSVGQFIEKKLETINSSFLQLIKTPFNDLLNVADQYGKVVDDEKEFLIDLYEKIRKRFGADIIKNLEINTCPYCNIFPVIEYTHKGRHRADANFDHFYPKSEYPIIAISLFNLVPVCGYCNQSKAKIKINFSPYNKEYFTDDMVRFYLDFKTKDEKEIILKIIHNLIENNVEVFKLKGKYKSTFVLERADEIFNIISRRAPNYSDADIQEFLSYHEQKDYIRKPLSKFEHDLIDQLLEIKRNY